MVFKSGALRESKDGKGRYDLLPLEVIGKLLNDNVYTDIACFMADQNNVDYLFTTLKDAGCNGYETVEKVAKRMEEGAKEYGENNWKKGLPTESYIDSALRHYTAWKAGIQGEDHQAGFCWNICCLIWDRTHNA